MRATSAVVLEPFYGYHVSTLRAMRAAPVVVPLTGPEFYFDAERLRAAITPRTRAIILNSPSNPSGKVFSRSELEALAEVAIEHDLFVFTDEMYEYFIYDGAHHISLATLARHGGAHDYDLWLLEDLLRYWLAAGLSCRE